MVSLREQTCRGDVKERTSQHKLLYWLLFTNYYDVGHGLLLFCFVLQSSGRSIWIIAFPLFCLGLVSVYHDHMPTVGRRIIERL